MQKGRHWVLVVSIQYSTPFCVLSTPQVLLLSNVVRLNVCGLPETPNRRGADRQRKFAYILG